MTDKNLKKNSSENFNFSHVKQIWFDPTFLRNERSNIGLILSAIKNWLISVTAGKSKFSWNNKIFRIIWDSAILTLSCCIRVVKSYFYLIFMNNY
jgi:hypothetical protein